MRNELFSDRPFDDEFEHLSDQLDTIRTTSEELADSTPFDREALDELRSIRNDLTDNGSDLDDLAPRDEEEEEIESQRRRIARDALEALQEANE